MTAIRIFDFNCIISKKVVFVNMGIYYRNLSIWHILEFKSCEITTSINKSPYRNILIPMNR